MANYNYKCDKCENIITLTMKISETTSSIQLDCTECDSNSFTKVILTAPAPGTAGQTEARQGRGRG